MRYIYFAVVTAMVLAPSALDARVLITEIMYDIEGTDAGREWVEVYNDGPDQVDLATWKLFEANSNHGISAQGSSIVPSGGFAIIADAPDKFKTDNPLYSGMLFDSAFSLSNSGETIAIKDQGGAESDSVTYSVSIGAQGNGHSLQKSSAGWIAAAPTAGGATTATSSEPPLSPSSSATTTPPNEEKDNETPERIVIIHSSHSNQSVANGSYDEPELIVTSGRPRLGYVGVPLSFEAKVKSMKNMPLGNSVGSTWSMGDGAQKSGQFISHSYDYPGEYTVILNSSAGGASAVSKVKVTIVEPKVELRAANRQFVELTNTDGRELNIGGWTLQSEGARFVIPQDTILSANSSVKLSSKNTALLDPQAYMQISDPSGKVRYRLGLSGVASVRESDQALIGFDASDLSRMKERIETASHGQIARARLASQNISITESASIDAKEIMQATRATSSPQTASVIYTVDDSDGLGWWERIKSSLKK